MYSIQSVVIVGFACFSIGASIGCVVSAYLRGLAHQSGEYDRTLAALND